MPGRLNTRSVTTAPEHCRTCQLEDCPVRGERFAIRQPFSLERATRGDETLDTGQPLEKDER